MTRQFNKQLVDFLQGVFACMFLALCGAASAADLTPVRVSVLPIVDTAPFYAAVEKGYFKDEGLDVVLQVTQRGGAVGIPGMVAGAYDVVYTNSPSVILAQQQGIDLTLIAGSGRNPQQPPDQVGLIALSDSKLASGKDLEGKSVAINARNNIQWLFVRAWIKATGGDPDKVNYREVPFPQMVDAVTNKQVDAAFAIEPFLTFGRRGGEVEVIGWPFHTTSPGIQMALYAMTTEAVRKNPELAAKFKRGMARGTQWVIDNADKDEYFELVNSYTKLPVELIASLPPAVPAADVDLASLEKMAELMRENNLLTSDLDPASMVMK